MFQAVVASAALILNDRAEAIFREVGYGDYYLLGLIAITIIGMRFADQAGDFIIERSRRLRRILAGKDDIEGDWVDIDYSEEDPETIRFVEFCRIRYEDGQYIISGDSWTPDGDWVQEFASVGSNFQDRTLTYTYRTGLQSTGGYGAIRFSPNDVRPTEFVCRYRDDVRKTVHVTRGRKIHSTHESLDMEERRDHALDFLETCEEEGLFSTEDAMELFDLEHNIENL